MGLSAHPVISRIQLRTRIVPTFGSGWHDFVYIKLVQIAVGYTFGISLRPAKNGTLRLLSNDQLC